jgi:hypothetical protein
LFRFWVSSSLNDRTDINTTVPNGSFGEEREKEEWGCEVGMIMKGDIGKLMDGFYIYRYLHVDD